MGKAEQNNRIHIDKVLLVLLYTVIALFVGYLTVSFVKIQYEGRKALREAKDVKFTLETTDIEYYGFNRSIFDATMPDGLAEGVKEEVANEMPYDGEYRITGYSSKRHEITGMRFTDGKYIITFKYDNSGKVWEVHYLWSVLKDNETEE